MRPGYRVRQFIHHLNPPADPTDLATAATVLPPGLLLLFRGMSPADQAHGVRVLNALRQQGESDPDLLAAALLHDVGKTSHPAAPWERAVAVLARRLWPQKAASWGQGPARGWRRAFVIARQHPVWGAQLVQRAGGSDRLVRLIRHHQQPPPSADGDLRQQLRALQFADDRN